VWKKAIKTKAEVVSSFVILGRSASLKAEYAQADTNASKMGAKPNRYHPGFTCHFHQLANKFLISVLLPVTPVMTTAAKLGVQEAMAINKPMMMSETDVSVTTAPIIIIVIIKNKYDRTKNDIRGYLFSRFLFGSRLLSAVMRFLRSLLPD